MQLRRFKSNERDHKAPRRGPWYSPVWVLVIAMLIPIVTHGEERRKNTSVGQVKIAVANVASRLQQLEIELKQPKPRDDKFDLEKRLVNATVFFGLGDFSKASILYYDLLRSPEFRTHSRYLDTKHKLGVCHFHAKNYRAAQTVLADLARVRSNFQQEAQVLLVESSLNLGDDDMLDGLIGQIERQGRSVGDPLRYVLAKAQYRRGKLSRALTTFGQVSPRSAQFAPSRYYRGVVYTEQGELDAATVEFRQVINTALVEGESPLGLDEDYGEVRQLARLALARIAGERGDVAKALEHYQDIDRRSPSFEVALYEMAWLMLEEENFEQALHTLDVLILIAKEERLLADANVMKSRLLMKLQRYEEASRGYSAVLDNFSPIQRELDRVARSDKRLDEYFGWLIERNVSGFDIQRPMTEKASAFVEKSQTIRPVASVFDQLGEEESTLEEAELVARELEAALQGDKRYDLVPVLAEKWARLTSSENDLIRLQSDLLNLEQGLLEEFAGADVAQQGLDRRRIRTELEAEFLSEAPVGPVNYQEKGRELEREFRAVERESFLARQLLERARKQLNAVEVWLADSNQTGLEPGGVSERKARMMLEEERERLRMLHEKLLEVSKDIDLESMKVGVVDLEAELVGGLKTELLRAQEEERGWIRTHLTAVESQKPLLIQEIRKTRREIRSAFAKAGRLSSKLETQLKDGLRKYASEVAVERNRLKKYETALKEELEASKGFVRNHGYALFRNASGELREVVLEADVGLIDVSWERKFKESTRIQTLMDERNQRLRELEESLKEITRDRDTGLVTPNDGGDGEASGEESP